MRLVKRTVNFDDPLTYHLYYGMEVGAPGTILTFFAWPNAYRGRAGSGQVNATALSVPMGSLGWWQERFKAQRITYDLPVKRFEEEVLPFQDNDGMQLELVAAEDERPAWSGGQVPADHRSLAFHVVYRDPRAATDPDAAKTLTDEEVDKKHEKVVEAVKQQFGAVLRA